MKGPSIAFRAARTACVVPHGLVRPSGTAHPIRQVVEPLVRIRDVQGGLTGCVMGTEGRLVLGRDHEHRAGGPGPLGVPECVVAQEFAARSERFQLLGSAEPGAAAGGKYEESPARLGHSGGFAWGTTSQVKNRRPGVPPR